MFSQSQNSLQENTLKFCLYTVPDMHNYTEVYGRRKYIRHHTKIVNSQGSCIRRRKILCQTCFYTKKIGVLLTQYLKGEYIYIYIYIYITLFFSELNHSLLQRYSQYHLLQIKNTLTQFWNNFPISRPRLNDIPSLYVSPIINNSHFHDILITNNTIQ